jgi:hypothetical protein
MNLGVIERQTTKGNQFIQAFNLTKGLQKYGKRRKQDAMKGMQQLHEHIVFEPISVDCY